MGGKTYQVLVDGDQQGPVDESWICVRLTSGELPPQALVWTEGMAEWAPAETLEQFRGLVPSPMVPPRAAPAPPVLTPPPPIPSVTHPPSAPSDDDDRTITVGHRPPPRGASLPTVEPPGQALASTRSVAIDTRAKSADLSDPPRQGWNRRERVVMAVLIGTALLLSVVVIVPWFKKRVLGTCDEVYDECVGHCEALFDTYADMQRCVGPCEGDRRQCVAVERPRVQVD